MTRSVRETLEASRSLDSPVVQPIPGVVLLWGQGPRDVPTPLPTSGSLVLGRDILTEDADDGQMSRRHAEVRYAEGQWSVRDLQSKNGTQLEGQPLGPEWVRVQSGALLRLGSSVFMLADDVGPFLTGGISVEGSAVVGPTLRAVFRSIEEAAPFSDVLYVTGESGSGKELAAGRFHQARGKEGPFVAVSCATIPETVAERLLFGSKRGAFSGAEDAEGYFVAADGGTLFLDEVAELSPAVQAKLLRVLETREVTPLGSTKTRKVDVRVCAATLIDLRDAVRDRKFREDLYYRLARPHVLMPPLRSRREEIPHLVVRELSAHGLRPHVSLIEACCLRDWPGNVRELFAELRAAARRASAAGSTTVYAKHLDETAGRTLKSSVKPEGVLAETEPSAPKRVGEVDKAAVEEAMASTGGNVSQAARALGLHRTQLRRLLEKFGLS